MKETLGRGGIINGAGLSSESVFSSKESTLDGNNESLDKLSMLEQGAASYDGSVPLGDDTIEDGSGLSGRQERASSVKVNQEKNLNF